MIYFIAILAVILIVVIVFALQKRAERERNKRWEEIPWTNERLEQFVRFYQGIGFYDATKTTEELMEEVRPHAHDIRGAVERGEAMSWRWHMVVLSATTSRVEWRDLEADVGPDEDVYVGYLESLAEISEGRFQPSNITETWDEDEGQVHVRFELNGRSVEVNPEVDSDWIDLMIVEQINALLPETDYRFEAVEQEDQSGQVLMLSREQKRALEERGWRFIT